MAVKDILVKLAEKEALNGNQDFAYNLVVLADSGKCKGCGKKSEGKMCSKCAKPTACSLKGCDVKKAFGEMIKEGDKCYCCGGCAKKDKRVKSALSELIRKYAQNIDVDASQNQNPYANDPVRGPIWQEGFDAASPQGSNPATPVDQNILGM